MRLERLNSSFVDTTYRSKKSSRCVCSVSDDVEKDFAFILEHVFRYASAAKKYKDEEYSHLSTKIVYGWINSTRTQTAKSPTPNENSGFMRIHRNVDLLSIKCDTSEEICRFGKNAEKSTKSDVCTQNHEIRSTLASKSPPRSKVENIEKRKLILFLQLINCRVFS